ncbi:hypothetical protein H9Q10_08280 [Eikenella sp. S3360]|uniref:FimV N-terminal domain-containing protein n=1 Tax=Eikenella glucosivorans TaxID=2766967 RepID=A0ABS0NBI1_9NEIS|nr:FimV/HubP family polar landmark protein [Eikenella glucosivorans]MBH5329662.1 hypothetical protein [Eikenella glucosivorans]
MKLIAASLGLVASVHAYAAMGGMQVQSRLNEPFSATVVVTGDEARALAGSAKPTINGANLNATVTHQGADRAVIRLRSSAPIKEPVMTFWLGVGNQNHQYTAMLDPRDYQQPGAAANHSRRERRAEAEPSRRRSSRHQERAAARREAPVQIQGRSYQIKDGELLVDIAEQVKPSGLTLRQTINALVAANPRAFRNGNPDLMYRGATLTIPDAETLRRLAHNPPRRVSTTHERAAADTVPANQQPQVTPPAETKPAVPVQQQPVTPPAPPAEPVQPAQQQPAVPPVASEPVVTPASAELPADQAEVLASMPEQASDMMASEPVVEPTPPVVAPPIEETPPMEEEGMDMMQMAMYGGGGLLVLGGLAYLLLNRRRKGAAPKRAQAAADEDDDDDLYFESVTDHSDSIAATPIAPAAPAAQPAPAAPVAAQQTVSEADLGLDLSHLDEQQQLGSTSSTAEAAQQAEADDWSWLAQAEEEPAAPAQAAPAAPVATVAETPAAEDEWLNFGSENPADVSAPVEAEAAPAAAQTESAADDLDWVLDETPAAVPQSFQTEPAPTVDFDVPAQPEAPAVENTALSFEMPELDSGSPQQEEAPAADVSNVMDFNLDFDTPSAPAAEPVVEAAPAAQPAAVADEPAVAGPLPKEALEAKLELAKMYLEIDDANTARQTLLELINESEGSSIQAQAQALLNDIGH